MVHSYEVTGKSAEQIGQAVNGLLEPLHSMMQNVQIAATPVHVRLRFDCEGTRKKQASILGLLRPSKDYDSVAALGPVQAE